jgi:hypothetical protein
VPDVTIDGLSRWDSQSARRFRGNTCLQGCRYFGYPRRRLRSIRLNGSLVFTRSLIVVLVALLPVDAVARVSRLCKVSYETRLGWSQEVNTEVTFMTGRELNRATKSWNFENYANYALIWFANDQVAIMKIDKLFFGIGPEFDNEDFRGLFQFVSDVEADQVNGDRDTRWRIKAKSSVRFIDPRADR